MVQISHTTAAASERSKCAAIQKVISRAVLCVTLLALFASLSGSSFAADSGAQAKSRAEAALASMPRVKNIRGVRISPDGTKLAWITRGGIMVQLTAAAESGAELGSPIAVPDHLPLRDIAWSPDSKQLTFLANIRGTMPAAQLWTVDAPGGTPEKLADFKGYVSTPSFSPDGKTIAVLFIEGMPRIAGPLMPMTPPEGEIDEHYYEQRITTVDIATHAVRQVSPSDLYVYEYDWAPDGKSWAVSAAHGSGDNNWWVARLYTISAETGQLHEVVKPKLQFAQPRFSPDGKEIAYISGIMSDEGSTGGDIYVVSASGGRARNLTPNMKASATWLTWTAPGKLLFTENVDGNAGVATVSTRGGDEKTLWSGFESISAGGWGLSLSLARDGVTSAVVRQSFTEPPELWAGPIGQWKKVTSMNSGAKPGWGETKNVHWLGEPLPHSGAAGKKQRIQGWLMFPRNYDPHQKYPLVVTVHGGPSAACMPHWDTANGAASALGYFVLCPNPRGSFGQGEAFTLANVKDFGGGDYRDIMAGIDSLAKQYPINLNLLGIHGHSYGGYMTMWAETQTHRFKAAVAGAGLSDWLSYYGENDIDEWMIPFFGASVYDDPAVYAKSSPITFVKNVKTPTLILVGDRDGEVPAPQSFEWWHALKTLHVPVTLVVYKDEGHAINKPADRHDYELRSLEWFEEWFGKAQQTKK